MYAAAAFRFGDQMKENEMGGAYGMHGRGETHTGVWWESSSSVICQTTDPKPLPK